MEVKPALWKMAAPTDTEPPGPVADSIETAVQVAEATRISLEERGFCLWSCRTLRGEIIAVVKNGKVPGIPEEYPVYTLEELNKTEDLKEKTLRLIHVAKKSGAKIISVEKLKK